MASVDFKTYKTNIKTVPVIQISERIVPELINKARPLKLYVRVPGTSVNAEIWRPNGAYYSVIDIKDNEIVLKQRQQDHPTNKNVIPAYTCHDWGYREGPIKRIKYVAG